MDKTKNIGILQNNILGLLDNLGISNNKIYKHYSSIRDIKRLEKDYTLIKSYSTLIQKYRLLGKDISNNVKLDISNNGVLIRICNIITHDIMIPNNMYNIILVCTSFKYGSKLILKSAQQFYIRGSFRLIQKIVEGSIIISDEDLDIYLLKMIKYYMNRVNFKASVNELMLDQNYIDLQILLSAYDLLENTISKSNITYKNKDKGLELYEKFISLIGVQENEEDLYLMEGLASDLVIAIDKMLSTRQKY